jgi:hypothetical protein
MPESPFNLYNETLDHAFHVSYIWLEFEMVFIKVGRKPFSNPVSAPERTQDMATNDFPPAAVGESVINQNPAGGYIFQGTVLRLEIP